MFFHLTLNLVWVLRAPQGLFSCVLHSFDVLYAGVFVCSSLICCVVSLQAVCCEDHEHCCPQGYTCNLEFGTCVKASNVRSVALTRLQTHTDAHLEEVLCDESTRCSKTQTCCRLSDSTWACCPYKEVWSPMIVFLWCLILLVNITITVTLIYFCSFCLLK